MQGERYEAAGRSPLFPDAESAALQVNASNNQTPGGRYNRNAALFVNTSGNYKTRNLRLFPLAHKHCEAARVSTQGPCLKGHQYQSHHHTHSLTTLTASSSSKTSADQQRTIPTAPPTPPTPSPPPAERSAQHCPAPPTKNPPVEQTDEYLNAVPAHLQTLNAHSPSLRPPLRPHPPKGPPHSARHSVPEQLLVSKQRCSTAALHALIDMSNTTTASFTQAERHAHWAFTTLSHLDIWCGSTCHTLLRYVLRLLLVLTLVGTFLAVLVRTLDPKRRAGLKEKLGLADASRVLGESKLGSISGTFIDAGMGAKMRGRTTELGGPDLRDSCAVM